MLANILLLVINAAAGFITLMLLARFYMQWQRISFRNQLGQFVVSTTDWIVRPLRRVVPGMFGLDMASLLPAWVVQVLLVAFELSLRGAVFSGNAGAVALGLLGVGLIETVRMMIYLLFAVVLGSAVLCGFAFAQGQKPPSVAERLDALEQQVADLKKELAAVKLADAESLATAKKQGLKLPMVG